MREPLIQGIKMNWLKKLWQGFKNLFGQDDGLNPLPVPPIVNPEPSVPTQPTYLRANTTKTSTKT